MQSARRHPGRYFSRFQSFYGSQARDTQPRCDGPRGLWRSWFKSDIYDLNRGYVRDRVFGFDDNPSTRPADAKAAHNYVRAALDDLKAGRPVREAVTRPYGCAVKY